MKRRERLAIQADTGDERNEPLPDVLAAWTGNLLYWVADVGAQYYARTLMPFGLRPPHVAALQILAHDGATPQTQLGDKLRLDKKTTAYLLNDLEKLGLAERRLHPTDGRAFVASVTAAGRARLAEVETASRVADREFFGAALSGEEKRQLHQLLTKLAAAHPPDASE